MPALEAAVGRSDAVEIEQRVEIAASDGPPVSLSGEPRDDRLGAGGLLGPRCGTTAEDPAPAFRLRDPRRIEGTGDREVAQVRKTRHSVGIGDAGAGDGPVVRPDQVLDRSFELLEEGGGDSLRARAHEDGLAPQIDPVRVRDVHPAIDGEERRPFAIHRDLDLFRVPGGGMERGLAASVKSTRGLVVERDPEQVVAVGGEIVDHGDPPAGSVGRPLHLLRLRNPPGNLISSFPGRGVRVADGEPGELARPAEISLEERRREHLGVGDVVEIRALGVRRKVVARRDVERQEIPDGALVLRPVEPLKRPAAGVGVGLGAFVESGLEESRERVEVLLRGPRHSGGGHHAGAELPDHLLRELRRAFGRRHVE